MPAIEVIIKAADDGSRGDCPFCQKVLMLLELKGLEYTTKNIDLQNKPEWFLKMYEKGSTPVMVYDGEVVPDSDLIVKVIEERHPVPVRAADEEAINLAPTMLRSMIAFFKNTDESQDESLKEAFVAELKLINDFLEAAGTPFLGGEDCNVADCALAPKLYISSIILGDRKGFVFPAELATLAAYNERIFSHPAFKATDYPQDQVIRSWNRKFPASS
eukprot:m.42382 g.42382  ORF g.42382 m.42382 type:complete len:217 (+) comp10683_c0_seq1:141-791(+)